ncbi:MAG TPA: DUF3558 family protein [Pseudonocardia sp.]|nr:DUF3558 family protein [Pseudonocardia sp.]
MTGRRWHAAVLPLLLSAVLGGCGTAEPQLPPVPGIADARDASAVAPCALLTPGQLAAAGFGGTGTPVRAQEGPSCRWSSGAGELDLTLYTDGGGLATLAGNSEPTTTRVRLSGYPALETFTGRGEFCQYDVGVAERQVVIATLDAPVPGSCAVLQQLVPQVVDNLPAGAGR